MELIWRDPSLPICVCTFGTTKESIFEDALNAYVDWGAVGDILCEDRNYISPVGAGPLTHDL